MTREALEKEAREAARHHWHTVGEPYFRGDDFISGYLAAVRSRNFRPELREKCGISVTIGAAA